MDLRKNPGDAVGNEAVRADDVENPSSHHDPQLTQWLQTQINSLGREIRTLAGRVEALEGELRHVSILQHVKMLGQIQAMGLKMDDLRTIAEAVKEHGRAAPITLRFPL